MTIDFTDVVPDGTNLKPILISGETSINYSNKEYLALQSDSDITAIYEIRYQAHCSPFKEVLLVDNLVAVAHEEYFYLFDITQNKNLVLLKVSGYFGHLYYDNDFFYVADASGLHCVDKRGRTLWKSSGLGIDGVIVSKFTDKNILGSGELAPPGGWEDFCLDKTTGKVVD